ncbi:replication initiation protein [Helicobacter monodelphidis]|uniref:replication initiation protein n=1 Tax=Helicobacter sp. 15-1451 TaxID=2004995 RepID=UPI000DCC72B9|nr:replication initiation protein [Helicobacter sp. 15-1451]RAX56376.1 replication initiation protein [Helicobacter sp. 15-1451]
MKKPTKPIKKRTQKAVVTQDNRFIYAKYDMNANEMKFFMWIVAQLHSQKDQLFQICEIPLSEIMQIWQWKDNSDGYQYVRNMCYSMSKKAYVEDFKILDEKTMKEVSVFEAMPLFKKIRYQEGQGYITYQLNDSLVEYLLDLKRDFTQLKFSDIQQMKSAYSIRIYNMLICELKQNRQSLKINLAVLQNILEVPKTLQEYKHFNQKVLTQAKKDINAKSNLVLFEIKTFKTGRKITDLEFIFDYKNNEKRIARDDKKKESFNLALYDALEAFMGKTIYIKDYGKLTCESKFYDEELKRVFVICKHIESGETINFRVRNFKNIKSLEAYKDKAEELFYLDKKAIEKLKKAKENIQAGNLFQNSHKKI